MKKKRNIFLKEKKIFFFKKEDEEEKKRMSNDLTSVARNIEVLLESAKPTQIDAAKRLAMNHLRLHRTQLLMDVVKILKARNVPFMATGSLAQDFDSAGTSAEISDTTCDLELAIMQTTAKAVRDILASEKFTSLAVSVDLKKQNDREQIVVWANVYNNYKPSSPILMIRVILQTMRWYIPPQPSNSPKSPKIPKLLRKEEDEQPQILLTTDTVENGIQEVMIQAQIIFPLRHRLCENQYIPVPFNLRSFNEFFK